MCAPSFGVGSVELDRHNCCTFTTFLETFLTELFKETKILCDSDGNSVQLAFVLLYIFLGGGVGGQKGTLLFSQDCFGTDCLIICTVPLHKKCYRINSSYIKKSGRNLTISGFSAKNAFFIVIFF